MTVKNRCQYCSVGGWYALQSGATAGELPKVVETTLQSTSGFLPFTGQVCLGLGWDFVRGASVDLDASVIALGAKGEHIDTVYYAHRSGLHHAIVHEGDNRSGDALGDDEVIRLDLGKMPPEVARLICVVNSFSGTKLSCAKSAYVRLFCGDHTLGAQKLTTVIDSVGLIFCFLQRNAEGVWFFQTMLRPVSGRTALQALPTVRRIFESIPLF